VENCPLTASEAQFKNAGRCAQSWWMQGGPVGAGAGGAEALGIGSSSLVTCVGGFHRQSAAMPMATSITRALKIDSLVFI
jgi:hypothetical protein